MKGFYTFICYPPDLEEHKLTIDDICQSIIDMGGQTAYILHDKDIKDNGELKDAHFHIIAAWAKSPPDWETFKSWMIGHYCSSPHTDKYGHEHKYHKETAVGRDIDAMIRYLTHGGD